MKWPAVALLCVASLAGSASAGGFVVDTTADLQHVGIDPMGGNTCDAGAGRCSLRAAIQAANANPGPDEITFAALPGPIALGDGSAGEDSAVFGDLDIRCSSVANCDSESLTITGNASPATVIEAMGLPDRVFDVVDPIQVTISNLEIRNPNGSLEAGDGTAIRNRGTLALANVKVEAAAGRIAPDPEAAILNSGASMTLLDVQVVDTTGAGVNAGSGRLEATRLTATGNSVAGLRAIASDAIVEVDDSTLSDNAIGFWSVSGRSTIRNSELSGNDSFEPGSIESAHGVLNEGFTVLEGCEISGNANTNGDGGGGILNFGTLELVSSRVTANDAAAGNGGGLRNSGRAIVRGALFSANRAPEGGGISNVGTISIVNTTVSGNSGDGITVPFDSVPTSETRIDSSTVVLNGIDLHRAGSDVSLIDVRNSIVQICQGRTVEVPDDVIESLGFNIQGDVACGFLEPTDATAVNLIGGTIEAALAKNGGPTESHRLLTGAFDSGIDTGDDTASCPLVDQRGQPRPFGACDKGAYERVPVAQCEDGLDNDGDGAVDFSGGDPGCDSAKDNLEYRWTNGTVFAASDERDAVYALLPGYKSSDPLPHPLVRSTGMAGPFDVAGRDGQILVVDALQGLVFSIDLDAGAIPRLFASTASLEFPRSIAFGPDGRLFAVGASSIDMPIVRIDPDTREAVDIEFTSILDNLLFVDSRVQDELIVTQANGLGGAGVFRVTLDAADAGTGTLVEAVTDPRGVEIPRTLAPLVVLRDAAGTTDDVISIGSGPIGVGVGVLQDPRGIAIEKETEIAGPRVEITMIVSERVNGQLHRIVWDGTTATETLPIFAEGLGGMFGVWVLRDRDEDLILDVHDDSDTDGLTDEFETGSGIFIDMAHPGTEPEIRDTDGDGLFDGFETHGGLDPLDAKSIDSDPDGDGLTNGEEQALGTNPTDRDSDDDGASDGAERDAGTDPNDPTDFPVVTQIPAMGAIGVAVAALALLLASRWLFGRPREAGR